MRYEGAMYRPPSEANSYILQATIGCSWNHCTYCQMYRQKKFRLRDLSETIDDIRQAATAIGPTLDKVFVADGDSLVLPMDIWLPILAELNSNFPNLRQISCYATAMNILDKTDVELRQLRQAGLSLLYLGPESGDNVTLKRIAKGGTFDDHVAACQKAHGANIRISAIMLLGIGGVERSQVHAQASADLVTAMDPEFVAALTLTVVPGTPQHKLQQTGRFELPDVQGLLAELRTIVDCSRPSNALFRTNHASNYLPLAGRLPRDRKRIVALLDEALSGRIPLRPEWMRGL